MLNSLIMYVGEREDGEALAAHFDAQDGYVYLPETMMQALGMYITYFPDVIVIDMRLPYAQEVYHHLLSVDAKPIILLTDEHIRSTSVFALPPGSSAEDVLLAIQRFMPTKRVPNGVLHYA